MSKQMTSPARLRRLRVALLAVVAAVVFVGMPAFATEPSPTTPTPEATDSAPTDPTPTATDEPSGQNDGSTEPGDGAGQGSANSDPNDQGSDHPGHPAGEAEPASLFAAPADCKTIEGPIRPADHSDDHLPCSEIPYELQPPPIPPFLHPTTSFDQLRVEGQEPTCAAPPLPDPTNAGDSAGDGYTLPIRLKMTNGIMAGGYNDEAWHHGVDMPFAIYNSRLTGWAVGRVHLPSLQVEFDPSSVVLCDSAGAGYSTPSSGSCLRPAVENGTDPDVCAMTKRDGSKYLNIPGPPFIEAFGVRAMSHLGVTDAVVDSMRAEMTGVDSTGRLRLNTDLEAGLDIAQYGRTGAVSIRCPTTLAIGPGHGRSMTTDPLAPIGAEPVPWPAPGHPGVLIPTAPKPPKIFLPGVPLSGAVEGGTATIMSNEFDLDVLGGAGTPGACRNTFPGLFPGINKWGMLNLGEPWYADRGDSSLNPSTLNHLPIPKGSAEMSMDVTVDHIGLPKGLPDGYGFE